MSEVKRYWVHWNDQLYVADKNGDLVMAEDFDRVTAERAAALGREDRAKEGLSEHWKVICDQRAKIEALQQRLTAADERADLLEGLLRNLPEDLKDLSGSENTAGVYACIDYIEQCVAALKPAESHPCPVSLDGCDGSCAQ